MSYDSWKSTDTAGDTADNRALPTAECLAGFHELCKSTTCICECHAEAEPEAVVQLYPCTRCDAKFPPVREHYVCEICHKVEESNPFPTIGCWCLVRGWVCGFCLYDLDKARQHG